ncbi:MAG TPA: EAL domain-containing protein [Acidimicrobiales bacterium]|nr:EAL domain-containing protein [Acidimicrobiales bacterium]
MTLPPLLRRPRGGQEDLRSAVAWWEAAFRTVSVGIAVLDAGTLEVVRVNGAFAAMLGWDDADGMVGSDLRYSVVLEDVGSFTAALDRALAGEPAECRYDLRWVREDGATVWLRVSVDVIEDGGRPVHLLLHAHDVTEQRRTDEALRASLDRLAEAQRLAHIGSFRWDVDRDRLVWSEELRHIFGLHDGHPSPGYDWLLDHVHAEDRAGLVRAMTVALGGEDFTLEHRIVRPDGEVRWVQCRAQAVVDDAGVVRALAGTFQDVTAAHAAQDQLRHTALHDALTGVANRALFGERMGNVVAKARRNGSSVSLLFVDIDDLKGVNDGLGHAAGDLLIQGVALRLQAAVRPGDTVARLGGDEFVVLLEDAGHQAAVAVAERVLDQLRTAFSILGNELEVGVSVGIAVADDHEAMDRLLAAADTALYVAKEAGKNRYAVFDASMLAAARERSSARRDLRSAIEGEQLVVHYQPVIDLTTGGVVEVEALVRWRHPERGMLPPTDFLPLADESGLAVAIGGWVLRQACAQAAAWRASHPRLGDLRVSVNLSGRQLQSSQLVDDVTAALRAARLAPECLTLEVSERLVDGPGPVLATVSALRDLGVRLAIDDFGAFSSSVRLLGRFTPGELKVDRSIVARLGAGDDAAVVAAAIDLGHALHLDTVAEGVETHDQLEALTGLGCDLGQGHYWKGPVPAEELGPWLLAVVGGELGLAG